MEPEGRKDSRASLSGKGKRPLTHSNLNQSKSA